jgi:EmrB/QacA subfamily drug resistance transporter
LVATIAGSSMTFIDGTVVNVALPVLQTELHATLTDVQWVVEAYAWFLGALILVGGSLGDQFGRRRMFLIGTVVFAASSCVCGLATSVRALIIGRGLQGMGAAFLVPGSLAIISATFEGPERGRAIGIWSGFSAITAAMGPVIGGWLIDHVSWRAVFFLNLPLAVLVVTLSLLFVDESRDSSRSAEVDWMGAALAVIALGAIVLGLLEWPLLGAAHWLVIGALTLGLCGTLLFVVVERRASNPMLPLELFRTPVFARANVLTLLLYAALAITLFLVPLNLIQVQHYGATAAGAALLPFPLIIFALSKWSGGLVARVGSRPPLLAGPLISALGLAVLARPGIGGSYWTTFFPAMVLLGVGMAVAVAPLTTTVMDAVESRRAGVASGVNNAVARVAGLLAIAIFGVILSRTFYARVEPRLDRLPLSASARSAIERELPKMTGSQIAALSEVDPGQRPAVGRAIDEAFIAAFRIVIYLAAVLALAAAACGAMIR